jgi:endonuclease/exonuclease/phosphatase family metal-dependent hydrolase
MPTLATFNANNFFLRYRFAGTFPGDQSKKSKVEAADVSLGYIPEKKFGRYLSHDFIVWDGTRRDLAAQALSEADGRLPDILCLQEVENMDAIRVLNERHLGGHYKYQLLIDGYDPRNIDVALLSVFPIVDIRSHLDDTDKQGKRILSRDCLEVTVRIGARSELTLFINHFKSKFVDPKLKAAAKKKAALDGHKHREKQAAYVSKLVKDRFAGKHDSALYSVVGDFNDTDQSPYLAPLLESPNLVDAIAETRDPDDRWTYYWRSKGRVQQIDYVLASRALARRIEGSHIERSGLGYSSISKMDDGVLPKQVTLTHFEDDDTTPRPRGSTPDKKIAFPEVRYAPIFDEVANNISDHCPVVVWF